MTAAANSDTVFAGVHARGRDLRLECRWIAPERTDAPLIVFLHEGLGSVSMWKDWPVQVCEAAGCRGLVYSRYGYGRSTARPQDDAWPVDFMHREAHDVLPALLEVLGVNARRDKPVLFGHSDGGSIALLYAARYPDAVAGVIAAAPHILVEDVSLTSIAAARRAYLESDLRARLGRHHQDVDSAFWGWNDIWLNPEFRAWNIEDDLSRITCPVLAIQGTGDEYGTLAQVHGIRRRAPQTELLEIPDCGHSPHRDQPATVVQAVARFVGALEKPG
ncbi:alpha/beta hydrolase [Achromobacter mucicolens]|jgi:pimeloyl-ACP methyl ester carboxylesterase|uniref:alpha/beta fold hydrolase n=1 Tax=Achromobacter TaxID=222 RepID=UPI00114E3CE2|nr:MULTISPECIES: alpha/beta hydrolase [Achromobacter]TQJ96889.1 pimeloyl-ACP methyl ester carboxylesterase [Achromobacter sp. SLBN-14]CAB3846061.1 2-succinyl-6-hydroxy-2, 4-cyclohexadiene-1-carboxylate synthase [Achromobacter mucicolens]